MQQNSKVGFGDNLLVHHLVHRQIVTVHQFVIHHQFVTSKRISGCGWRLGLRSKPRPNSSRRNCHRRPTISQAAKCSLPIVFLFVTVGNCNLCDFAVPPQRRNLQSAWIPAKPKVYLWGVELTFELKVLRVQRSPTFFFVCSCY